MDVGGRTVQVRSGKALPFEQAQDCTLDIHGGDSWDADPSEAGTKMWEDLVNRILSMSGGRLVVMIVGAADTGKSTLSTYIANMAIARNILPCVIDGDMGQGDLAPPAAIGAALVREQAADLRDVEAGYYEFIGSITPAGLERLVADRMKSILTRTKKVSCLHIINTDGYIADGGAAYKKMLARKIAPCVIVNLGRGDHLSLLARGRWLFLRAPSSGQATKTWSDRAGRRMDQFMRHVGEGAASVRTDRVRFVYRARPISLSMATRLFLPSMEGMFVGLGLRGIVKGFGVIDGVNEELRVRTGVGRFDTVYLSNIALRGGEECRLSG
jgi:polynucleotide 5'-hydroxyl-kinase GRC3/NOL9